MNKGVAGLIIIGVIVAVAASLPSEKEGSQAGPSTSAGEAVASVDPAQMSLNSQVIVYYFHGNFRCASCTHIEKLTKEAVESGFADHIKSGLLSFKTINIEKPGYGHFVQDYQLYTKSVVLSLVKGGKEVKFKNLDKVWEYLRDPNRFDDYVRSGVAEYLEAVK